MNERIGLYGGSFDPIHFGHLIIARSVAERIGLSRVILIPSARPPHKRGTARAAEEDRLAMTYLAVEQDPLFEVSDVELHRPGPSYTIDTVDAFRARLGPTVELFWIIGADSLPELATWHRVAALVQRVSIVTAARTGWEQPDLTRLTATVGSAAVEALRKNCLPTPRIEISATQIRERLAEGRSVRYLIPDAVASYIERNNLYR